MFPLKPPWRRNPAPPPVSLVLYTRSDCPLCEKMKAEIRRAKRARPLVLREVDIARSPELTRRFGRSIPVLEVAGRVAFKGRLRAEDLERKLERIAREAAGE